MNLTVGITSYNQRELLVEAIDSVIAQTVKPAEIVIVDDASQDDSPRLIEAYAQRYPDLIYPVLLDRNAGPNAARNHIIDRATGEYLSFLDGDDRWLPSKLEREAKRLQLPDHPDGVFSNFYFIRKNGERAFLWATDRPPPQGYILAEVLTLDLPRTTLFRSELAPTAMWREAGYFDDSFEIYGDWDMRVRLATVVPSFAYVDEPLCEYRRHGGGLSNKPVDKHLAAVDHIESKYADLIARLTMQKGNAFPKGFNRFRAKLLRRAALDTLLKDGRGARGEAIGYYKLSMAYDRVLDPRFFWYLLKP